VKPEITGWLRKLISEPRRSTPIVNSIRPLIRASAKARAMKCSLPYSARSPRTLATINETMATGPTAKARLEPNRP